MDPDATKDAVYSLEPPEPVPTAPPSDANGAEDDPGDDDMDWDDDADDECPLHAALCEPAVDLLLEASSMLSPLPTAAATSPANRSGIIHCSPASPFPAWSNGELLSAVLDERFTVTLTEKQLTDAMKVARDIIGICESRLQHKTGSKYPTVYNRVRLSEAAIHEKQAKRARASTNTGAIMWTNAEAREMKKAREEDMAAKKREKEER